MPSNGPLQTPTSRGSCARRPATRPSRWPRCRRSATPFCPFGPTRRSRGGRQSLRPTRSERAGRVLAITTWRLRSTRSTCSPQALSALSESTQRPSSSKSCWPRLVCSLSSLLTLSTRTQQTCSPKRATPRSTRSRWSRPWGAPLVRLSVALLREGAWTRARCAVSSTTPPSLPRLRSRGILSTVSSTTMRCWRSSASARTAPCKTSQSTTRSRKRPATRRTTGARRWPSSSRS
mmetsp:Transcript_3765/g.9109  ORF Transcript_3765/g.9109 Transcript_3765/m.9109 type:complete len:234 (+) Transcript_3765:400-1101(+)